MSSNANSGVGNGIDQSASLSTSEEYLNKKIAFIQNHINNLIIEITNLPEPWTYAVTEDGRVFFINESEQKTTWLHPKTGQPVSVMIIPPLEDLPTGWQSDQIYGLPYLIDHNSKQNYLVNTPLNATGSAAGNSNTNTASQQQVSQTTGGGSSSSSTSSSASSTSSYSITVPPPQLPPSSSVNNNNNNNNPAVSVSNQNYSEQIRMRSPSKQNPNRIVSSQQQQQLLQQQEYRISNEYPSKHTNSVESIENNLTSASMSNSSNSPQLPTSGSNRTTASTDLEQMNIITSSDGIDSALRKYGWLYKLSQNGLKLWRKRYFVLTDYILDYYSDSTMSKHCGTIFLNDTHSRPTIKKDGSSAFSKKHSFKVELKASDSSSLSPTRATNSSQNANNDMFVYLAADSTSSMNEWINKFNFVSKLKNSSQNRGLYEKRVNTASNRSSSNTSTRTNSSTNYFMIKHDNSNSKSNLKSSKSNSAPSSPNLSSGKNRLRSIITEAIGTNKNTQSGSANNNNNNNNNTNSTNVTKLRPSISSSSNVNKSDDRNKKIIKKKLAFSDDEILNDERKSPNSNNSRKNTNKYTYTLSDNETDYEYPERINSSFNTTNNKHKRSTSLTKSAMKQTNLTRDKIGSTNALYDHKPIYDAFEKPIDDLVRSSVNLGNSLNNYNNNYNIYANGKISSNSPSRKVTNNYLDKDKIDAVTAAIEREREKDREKDDYMSGSISSRVNPTTNLITVGTGGSARGQYNNNYSQSSSSSSPSSSSNSILSPRVIKNFYYINKSQIESLSKSELQMLIRQLRRNFVLLNHSQQRFLLLHKLYEPYESVYQSKQATNKDDANMSELHAFMHDSYQTMKDRIKKIEIKMDTIENTLKIAQQQELQASNHSSPDDLNLDNQNSDVATLNISKFSQLFKLYEYQIIEMQHEYELLLEDKIIIEKLLDNQMRIFSKFKNLSYEKTLIQQFNALNQEMDLLNIQIAKVNQLQNDTISEKCKQELLYKQHQQQQQQQNQQIQHQQQLKQQQKLKNDNNNNLFRASLVPVGSLTSSSSIWKTTNSPLLPGVQKKTINTNTIHFTSSDNLDSTGDYAVYNNTTTSQLQQPAPIKPQPQQSKQNIVSHNPPQQQHYYYPNQIITINQTKNPSSKLMESNGYISKSTDSIYASTKNDGLNSSMTGLTQIKKSSNNLDAGEQFKEIQISFQPVNFTNVRPKQLTQQVFQTSNQSSAANSGQHQSLYNTVNSNKNNSNFKRDVIAEKRRSSIGKYPQTYYNTNIQTNRSAEYFQPIPVHHSYQPNTQPSQQSARERLFGNNYQQQIHQSQTIDTDQVNNRKIAMVKPELRGSNENDIINRFTHQNQMEYFDTDYSEEIAKNIQKPEVFAIPRGNLDLEPELELTEEEKMAKEKRMHEIKKMIALQSLQQLNIDDPQASSNYNNYSNYSPDFNFEKEKRAREQLLDLRHELAEQIKEKTRQVNMNHNGNHHQQQHHHLYHQQQHNGNSYTPPKLDYDHHHYTG